MILTSLIIAPLALTNFNLVSSFNTTTLPQFFWDEIENITTVRQPCPDVEEIENGFVRVQQQFNQIARIECNEGYYLDSTPAVYCINGKWEFLPEPQCNKRCKSPPDVRDGSVNIEKEPDVRGLFLKGTLATYSCRDGFELKPPESKYRVCEKGIWTGPIARCVAKKKSVNGCLAPREMINGYYVYEKNDEYDGVYSSVGQRLHYSCNTNYILLGSPVQQCLDDGTWSPRIPPICAKKVRSRDDSSDCPAPPIVPHSITKIIQDYQINGDNKIVEIRCISKYRNSVAPCQPGRLRCINGKWEGVIPICVPVHECEPPAAVSYAVIYNLNPTYESTLTNKYPVKSQISYQCLPGYTLQGNEIFACSTSGCWLPIEPPTCIKHSNYFLEVNSLSAVQLSIAIGAGVWALLLTICIITVCKRRKTLSRAVPIAPPVQRSSTLGDHASLLHHPDRLALIAFADGMQNDQGSLPTYDEATRERNLSVTSISRMHRPHWSNLAGRRSRNIPNPDIVHITRHGSFASHTPSTRSAADSMGSTDTVAVSEGSTNVTLDTASSHSGSQPASCRAHCGSLASFDTSSVVNTEGVPLLEESELEEIQGGDNISLVVENPSISDNASFKLSTNSAE